MSLTKEQKQGCIDKFGSNAKDTGKPEVQVAILTKDIEELTEHLKKNTKDHASKRGLQKKVSKRKGLLGYLQTKNIQRYRDILKQLGLRK